MRWCRIISLKFKINEHFESRAKQRTTKPLKSIRKVLFIDNHLIITLIVSLDDSKVSLINGRIDFDFSILDLYVIIHSIAIILTRKNHGARSGSNSS